MITKDLKLDIKSIGGSGEGTFEGYLSVYNIVDLGNDVVEKGAFTKTLKEQKGVVPLLIAHDMRQPAGTLTLTDDDIGLKVNGTMFIEESPKAKEWWGIAKRLQELGRPMGLSIGFEAVKKTIDAGIRHLREVKLYEGSLTMFPMLPEAQLTGVKQGSDTKSDFLTELDEAQTWSMRYIAMQALDNALYSIVWDDAIDGVDAKVKASEESIRQFLTTYTSFLPKLLALMGMGEGMKERKERLASQSSALGEHDRVQIREAIDRLKTLLGDESGAVSNPKEPEVPTPPLPANGGGTQDDHSAAFKQFLSDLNEEVRAL